MQVAQIETAREVAVRKKRRPRKPICLGPPSGRPDRPEDCAKHLAHERAAKEGGGGGVRLLQTHRAAQEQQEGGSHLCSAALVAGTPDCREAGPHVFADNSPWRQSAVRAAQIGSSFGKEELRERAGAKFFLVGQIDAPGIPSACVIRGRNAASLSLARASRMNHNGI